MASQTFSYNGKQYEVVGYPTIAEDDYPLFFVKVSEHPVKNGPNTTLGGTRTNPSHWRRLPPVSQRKMRALLKNDVLPLTSGT